MQKCIFCMVPVMETRLEGSTPFATVVSAVPERVFNRLPQRLVELGSVQEERSAVGAALDVYVEERILDRVREAPETISRNIARETGVCIKLQFWLFYTQIHSILTISPRFKVLNLKILPVDGVSVAIYQSLILNNITFSKKSYGQKKIFLQTKCIEHLQHAHMEY